MIKHRRLMAVGIAATMALAVAACAGDDDASDTVAEAPAPPVTEPQVSEPETTEPEVTEPEATEPEATEPETTEPEATEPETTEPETTEPESTTAPDDGGTDAAAPAELVSAAQEEGSLVWYSVPAESIAQAVSDGFQDEYGIAVEFQRLASSELSQRYAAEVDAGTTVADAILMSNTPFVREAMENGWTTPLADADIPGFPGDWPEEFLLDDRGTAIVSIEPSVIGYNTDVLSEDQYPVEWADLADPAYEGEILLIDPAASPAYIDFWSVILEATGPEVLEGIAANAVSTYPSGVPAIEALAAGEGAVVVPAIGAVVEATAARGAPVAYSLPTVSNGPEIVALVSADAPHPNAARLFAWYVMYGPGQDLLNAAESTASPLTGDGLPPDYRRSPADAQSQAETILDLLSLG